jgi:hypothetical protein
MKDPGAGKGRAGVFSHARAADGCAVSRVRPRYLLHDGMQGGAPGGRRKPGNENAIGRRLVSTGASVRRMHASSSVASTLQ